MSTWTAAAATFTTSLAWPSSMCRSTVCTWPVATVTLRWSVRNPSIVAITVYSPAASAGAENVPSPLVVRWRSAPVASWRMVTDAAGSTA